MKRAVWICVVVALASAGAALAADPATAQPAKKFGPEVAALVAQAAKEGKLDLSWSGSGFADNGKDVPRWIDAFNNFYGFHLPYNFTPAPSMAQQAAAVLQAAQSNTPAFSDAVILGPDFLLTDIKGHATSPRDWAALAKEIGVELPPKAVAPDEAAVAFSTGIFGIVYNKNEVAPNEVPQNLEDVLKSQWKGRLASTPYAAGFSFLAAFDPNWGPARTNAFVAKLAQQIGGLIRCGDPGPLLSGQFDMLVLECDISGTILAERRGVPVGYVVPKDASISDLWYMAVPKTAPDPAAGTLLALFMLTKEGQDISWQSDGNDLALFPGSRSAALLGDKAATIAASQDFAAHPETLQYISEHIKLLTGGEHK